jgi:hypothetical protein
MRDSVYRLIELIIEAGENEDDYTHEVIVEKEDHSFAAGGLWSWAVLGTLSLLPMIGILWKNKQ